MAEQLFTGSLKPGIKLGKYEIRGQMATGGMAVIYKAYDPSLDRYVAVKQIAPHLSQDPRFLERFRTEAQTLARLSATQANIVNVHELIQDGGQLYLVMECVEGTTLRTLMDRGPVPLQTGLGVLLSTALGLKAMHAQGIVHRDLTPANIMMAKDGALKITDFGLIGHSGGKTSLPMGTTKYMAPEMFTGAPVDARADLYSLGMIAYEMFVGPEKFAEVFRDVLRDDRAQQVRWMHWHSNPVQKVPALRDLQPGIPPLVVKIVERMMEKDPSRRFASSEQIIKWLRRIFVMHVQGKSISQTDSATLEKEIDADATAPVQPPVAASARAPQPAAGVRAAARGQAAAGAVAVQPGMPLPAESGETTAPLPVPKWTWKRAVFWAAVIGGPLLAAATGLLVWDHYETKELERAIAQVMSEAEDQFNRGEWALADQSFTDIGRNERFSKLEDKLLQCKQHALMARAELALEQKEWDKAASNANTASQKFGVSHTWVSDFMQRFNKARDVGQVMKEVELAATNASYEQAIALLDDLQRKYADLDLNAQIAEFRERKELGEYKGLVDQGKQHFERKNLPAAQTAFEAARKIRPGSEVDGLLQMVATEKQYLQYVGLAQKAVTDGKWGDAVSYYMEIMKIRPSEAVRTAMNNAKAEELAGQARLLAENKLVDKATELYTQVLSLNPNHAEALDFLKKAGRQQTLDNLVKTATAAAAAGQWDQVLNTCKDIEKLLTDADADLKIKVEEWKTQARYQTAMARAVEALNQKKFDEALAFAQEAQSFKDTSEVAALIEKIETHRQYYAHLTVGQGLMSQPSYVEALKSFEQAQKVMDTQEVRDLINECNYLRYLGQGKSYLQSKRPREALSVFKMAQRCKDTVEIQGWIAIAIEEMKRLEQQESKKK
ncbi:MAG: hypothetical protein AMS14_03180 [Planctomycetes bacterium DG_20]|nr:MAG: hypothetical protein AMS14_03180 [Planctomycetes bacterium DG_20]